MTVASRRGTAAPAFRAAQRISAIGVSEILKIGAVAAQRSSRAARSFLGAGEPDFDTPDSHQGSGDRVRCARPDQVHRAGRIARELKAAIRDKFARENGLDFAADEISVGAGAKQVMHNAMMATLDPGDEVVLAAPYWTSYADIVQICRRHGRWSMPCSRRTAFRLQAAGSGGGDHAEDPLGPAQLAVEPDGAAYSAAQLQPLLDVLLRHPQVWLSERRHLRAHRSMTAWSSPPRARLRAGAAGADPHRQRRLQVLRHDRLADRLWRRAQGADQRDGGGAEPDDVVPVLDQPGRLDRGAERSAGFREGACQLSSGAEISWSQVERDRRARLPRTGRRLLHLFGLRRHARQDDAIRPDRNRRGFLRLSSMTCDVAVVPGSAFGLSPFFRISYATSARSWRWRCGGSPPPARPSADLLDGSTMHVVPLGACAFKIYA